MTFYYFIFLYKFYFTIAGKTLKECLCLYFRMKDVAFVGRRPYSSEPLEEMLKECLGTTSVMADISKPK